MCVGLGGSSEYITEYWANLALLFISNESFMFTQQCSAAGAPLLRLVGGNGLGILVWRCS